MIGACLVDLDPGEGSDEEKECVHGGQPAIR